ncbi:MAG: methyltransferase domain-containing protein [Gemmatimonadota bacterium]|nr:MAG: methyltransferase domain-containing protein [Gemmatimonadota bacterium]
MPILLKPLERLLMVSLNQGPAPLLDIVGGFAFHAIAAALRLNLFEELRNQPLTIAELADATHCSERGVANLVEVLESLGYVRRKGQRYANSAMTEKWMTREPLISLCSGFSYYSQAMTDLLPFVHESIRSGTPYRNFYDWISDQPDASRMYQRFMMSLARLAIPEFARRIQLKQSCRTVLDVGGGHGLYSVALCRKYDSISVTIFDSPYARELAEQNIGAAQMEGRIQFVAGDYFSDDFDSKYDAVMLFNVVHEHTDSENRMLIRKISGSLSDGGSIIIMDVLREKKALRSAELIARTYSLLFFHTVGGQTYSYDEIADWLASCGLSGIRRIDLRRSGLSLICAEAR